MLVARALHGSRDRATGLEAHAHAIERHPVVSFGSLFLLAAAAAMVLVALTLCAISVIPASHRV